MKKLSLLVLSLTMLLAAASCSKVENASGMEGFTGIQTEAGDSAPAGTKLLILNEGAFPGKSTLDVLNFSDGKLYADVFAQANPTVTDGLGNTGNDMEVIGNTIWILMNASNQVVILNAFNYKHIATIDIDSPRSIVTDGSYAYITSYGGATYGSSTPTLGMLYRISTSDYHDFTSLPVGYQPEGLAILDGKLYVANSGGYNAVHDNTVSVIDLATFEPEKSIELPVTNLNMVRAASGKIWVSTYGESTWSQDGDKWIQKVSAPMSLVSVSPDGTSKIISGVHADKITASDGIIYAIGNDKEMDGGYDTCLYKVNSTSSKVETIHFSGTDLARIGYPYCILVNPDNGEIIIADASFTGDSTLWCFTKDYKYKWSVTTGVGTGHLLMYRM